MLGMKINMMENKIQFEPQIPDSLLNVFMPINFEYRVPTKKGAGKLQVIIEPDKKRISANFKNYNSDLKPDMLSNSYSIN
jgi:hypothetical protein